MANLSLEINDIVSFKHRFPVGNFLILFVSGEIIFVMVGSKCRKWELEIKAC